MTRSSALLALLALASVALPGCRSLGTGAGSGAVIGTAVGTAAGYAIGRHNGETWRGAGIGAVTGGLLGAAIGDSVEPAHRAREIEGPTVYRSERAPSPRIAEPDSRYRNQYPARQYPASQSGGQRVTVVEETYNAPVGRERVIIRDIYPDGTVRERTVILE